MPTSHRYKVTTVWTGNRGPGAAQYDAYERSYDTVMDGKAPTYRCFIADSG